MKVAVVGVTGMVGRTMLEVLSGRHFEIDRLIPVASARSKGKEIEFKGRKHPVMTLDEALEADIDIALFSAGGSVSKEWAPRFAARGVYVIDNSSAWRMDPEKKLIIPEINGNLLTRNDFIIANPNCSTIQMLMVLAPLYRKYGLKEVIVSTYQSVTGTGYKAVEQMESERQGIEPERVYPHPIDKNALPHCDDFTENGYTKEEMKMVHETHKILDDATIPLSATAVRIPVSGGHGESVHVKLGKAFEISDIRALMEATPGVQVSDNPGRNIYPTPLQAHGRDDVFIGRIRKDIAANNALSLWIVADNLRKGAATNAVQIAEYLVQNVLK